ncbi:MAG: response regulator transcription factor [Acetatifactor sp.]|nr:response regulator transcription factor [Acetatifactor sp.]
MTTIAIIEDDTYIGGLLEETLTQEGYSVIRAYSGTEALLLLEKRRPDLILLDLMLPGLTGEELLPRLGGIPVIVLSARAGIDDKVKLLTEGAADYMTKPFDIRELLARIAVQLRKTSQADSEFLTVGELNLDVPTQLLNVSCQQPDSNRSLEPGSEPMPDNQAPNLISQTLHLTKTEAAILKLLMQNPGQVIAKSVLLDRISMEVPECTESSLKVHVSNLRKKLKTVSDREYIESVWGIGFRLYLS